MFSFSSSRWFRFEEFPKRVNSSKIQRLNVDKTGIAEFCLTRFTLRNEILRNFDYISIGIITRDAITANRKQIR